MADRAALHAYLSDEAHQAWHHFAEETGVSLTGVLEAIAAELVDPNNENLPVLGTVTVRQLAKAGRRIDAARRRRS